jgi:cold shock protein
MSRMPLFAVLGPSLVLTAINFVMPLQTYLPTPWLTAVVALIASVATFILAQPRTASSNAPVAPAPAQHAASATKPAKAPGKEQGHVKWFNAGKGFGFITRANGEEIFVHYRAIGNGRALKDGQKVEYVVTNGTKGLQAEQVVALK